MVAASVGYFAVPSDVLGPAVTEAYESTEPVPELRGRTVHDWALAAIVGIAKQEYVGRRWSPVVPPDTWESLQEDHAFSDRLIMPVERLFARLAGRTRLIGTTPPFAGYHTLVPLGVERDVVAELTEGDLLSHRLRPQRPPDEQLSYPPELCVIDQAKVGTYRVVVLEAIESYRSADAATVATIAQGFRYEPGEGLDRLVYSILALYLTVTDVLFEGTNEVLVARVL